MEELAGWQGGRDSGWEEVGGRDSGWVGKGKKRV